MPRRIPVFVSKLFTITVFSALFSAACAALTLGAAVILAGIHDVPVEQIGKLTALGARGLIPAVALAAVGFCVGLLARHTAAAIGVLLGYLVLWFVRNGPLSQLAWAQRLTPWTPEGNLSAVVGNGSTYEVLRRRADLRIGGAPHQPRPRDRLLGRRGRRAGRRHRTGLSSPRRHLTAATAGQPEVPRPG